MDNASLAKLVSKKIKAAHKGALCRVGYVGTGSQSNRRQLWVRLPSDTGLDIWFEEFATKLGGVVGTGSGTVRHAEHGNDAEKIADAVVALLTAIDKARLAARAAKAVA